MTAAAATEPTVLSRDRVLRAKLLQMSLRFKGNAAVAPARRTYRLPIKGRG